MRIATADLNFEWLDSWANLPDTASSRSGWCHPGAAITASGDFLTTHPGEPVVLTYGPDGRFRGSWSTDLVEVHALTLVREDGVELLWLVDNGAKRDPELNYQYPGALANGQVIKTTLAGEQVAGLERPELAGYRERRYSPTSVAVFEERHGGNGDLWVADGYGANLVHRFTKHGEYVASISGEEGAGSFATPHGVWIDTRRAEPELLVADRVNHRVQVYDLEGRFKRAFGADYLSSPSAFAPLGDLTVIAELRARLTVVDADDRLVGYLGENEAVCAVDGWPNIKDEGGKVVRTSHLAPGKFNSPHGIATDPAGNIYIAEWLIGGRVTKLATV